MNIRNLDMADYFMAMGGVMTITYTGLMISLSRYNRHQRDSPACWMDGHYLRVKPHPPQENIYLLHVPQNLSQDVNENRYLDWFHLHVLHLFPFNPSVSYIRSPKTRPYMGRALTKSQIKTHAQFGQK
ncbi:hypothetical protein EYB25_000918 [Talaromyces marneffei]|nr:hypothetical protein EYB25_000918 [Talaromyces marneffei]